MSYLSTTLKQCYLNFISSLSQSYSGFNYDTYDNTDGLLINKIHGIVNTGSHIILWSDLSDINGKKNYLYVLISQMFWYSLKHWLKMKELNEIMAGN